MSDTPINFAKLEEMKEVMGEIFIQLLPAFIEQSDELIGAMPGLLSSGTIDVLERNAHSIKSSSLNVGAEHLSEIARVLEDMSRNNDSANLLNEKITAITDEYANVKTTLQNYLQSM